MEAWKRIANQLLIKGNKLKISLMKGSLKQFKYIVLKCKPKKYKFLLEIFSLSKRQIDMISQK